MSTNTEANAKNSVWTEPQKFVCSEQMQTEAKESGKHE